MGTVHARPIPANVVAALAVLALITCFALPLLPRLPCDELVRTTTWSLAALASFVGFGGWLARIAWPSERVGLALRGVLGASLLCFAGGSLACVALVSRWFFFAFVATGVGLLVRECVMRRAELAAAVLLRVRAARLAPIVAIVGAVVAAGVVIQFLGGASDVSTNVYDDDVSYYPFAKQLLQRGTLLDPFSFRRMSTLGGQALHHALLLTRVGILHLNVFDRGMCFVLAAGLLLGHRVGSPKRRVPIIVRFLSILFLVGLPNLSINSASHYSGLAFFLALFQMLEMLPREPATTIREATRRLFPFALTAAALSTLRQNYQATVGILVVVTYASMWLKLRHRVPSRKLAIEPLVCVALIGAFLLPWLVLLYRSNDTFLFPLMRGTFRADVAVTSRSMTLAKLVRFFVQCWFNTDPIQTLPFFAFTGLLIVDDNPRRPLASQWLALVGSFAMLCVAFSLADAGNLSRYIYGYATASILLTWHAVAMQRRTKSHSNHNTTVLAAIAVVALLLPLHTGAVAARKMLDGRMRDITEMLRRSGAQQLEPPVARVYHRLQDEVPAGAPILVMLDQPYLLDFARNPIFNLDMPGTASPKPNIPCFQGPEPVANYLLALGIRYVMFVSPDKSAFLYRHDIWLDHVLDADEIWRIYAPYMTDVMNNLVELAKTRTRLADEADIVLVDLDAKVVTSP